ncbi:MAG: hypothetical protein L3J82_10495 [Planctomycetes bacterium]|nr:hypothetical protein [Planctomycetota bacterium]
MNKIQTVRLGIGDDITARITEHLKQAVMKSSALEFAPAVFVSGVERRAKAIEGLVGASFLRGTPERISRELLTHFMPQLNMRNPVERDFDFFGALTATLQTLGENRHASRALVEQLIEARKRLAENYAPVDRNNDALKKLGSRGELLAGVLELYSQRLKQTNTFDQGDAPWLAAENMSDWESFAPKLLVIEELTQVRPARKRFLHALMQRAEQTILIVREGLPFTQNATSELLDSLKPKPEKPTLERVSLPFGKLAIALLADSITPMEPPENLILRRSFSRFSEVRDTAQEIKSAVRAGCLPQEIAVVAPSLGRYETLIEETFRAAGIPFDSAYAAPIDLLPPVAPILDLVRCARNGLDRLELIDALSSPYLRFDAENDQARLKQLNHFESASREANIVGGRNLKKDWLGKIDGQKGAGKQLKKQINAVLKLLLPFTKPQIGAATFMSDVSKLLEASCAADVLAEEKGDDTSATRSEALHEFRKLLRDMAAEFKLAGDPKLRCSEVLQALLEQCRTREIRQPEQHADRVQILGLRELQLSSFKQVFILGLTDLDLPLSESDSMFFSSVREEQLKEVFGKPQVSMFEMAGLIGKHVK